MVIGIRIKLLEKGTKIKEEGEGIMMRKVRAERDRWRIVGVYIRRENWDEIMGKLGRWMETAEEEIRTIIGNNFNVRIAEEGGRVTEEEE